MKIVGYVIQFMLVVASQRTVVACDSRGSDF